MSKPNNFLDDVFKLLAKLILLITFCAVLFVFVSNSVIKFNIGVEVEKKKAGMVDNIAVYKLLNNAINK